MTVTADVDVLGVHGPYVSYEYRTDMDVTGERDERRPPHRAPRRARPAHGTGGDGRVAVRGARPPGALEGDASAEWKRARDSLLALRDRRSRRAQRVMAAFDVRRQQLHDRVARRASRASCTRCPARRRAGSLSALELAPREVPATPWWHALRDELPAGPDSLLSWKHGGLELRAALRTTATSRASCCATRTTATGASAPSARRCGA